MEKEQKINTQEISKKVTEILKKEKGKKRAEGINRVKEIINNLKIIYDYLQVKEIEVAARATLEEKEKALKNNNKEIYYSSTRKTATTRQIDVAKVKQSIIQATLYVQELRRIITGDEIQYQIGVLDNKTRALKKEYFFSETVFDQNNLILVRDAEKRWKVCIESTTAALEKYGQKQMENQVKQIGENKQELWAKLQEYTLLASNEHDATTGKKLEYGKGTKYFYKKTQKDTKVIYSWITKNNRDIISTDYYYSDQVEKKGFFNLGWLWEHFNNLYAQDPNDIKEYLEEEHPVHYFIGTNNFPGYKGGDYYNENKHYSVQTKLQGSSVVISLTSLLKLMRELIIPLNNMIQNGKVGDKDIKELQEKIEDNLINPGLREHVKENVESFITNFQTSLKNNVIIK